MFGFFKKKPPQDEQPDDPPTEKQLRYARVIGIAVTPEMDRWDVSAAIDSVERANPQFAEDREQFNRMKRERELGAELIADETRWQEFAKSTKYMLAIFRRRKEIIVDVLSVYDAEINDRGKLILYVVEPKLVRDRYNGDYLFWSKDFNLAVNRLLHYESLDLKFGHAGIRAYQKVVKRGLKTARKINR